MLAVLVLGVAALVPVLEVVPEPAVVAVLAVVPVLALALVPELVALVLEPLVLAVTGVTGPSPPW